jgi:imidazolonepropionase-like amidohydrolase
MGASAASAVQAATIRAAAVCRMEGEIGSLEAGKVADLIAVNGSPYEDIDALKRVALVIQAGSAVKF